MTDHDKHIRILIPSRDPKLSNERVWAVPHASIPNVYRVDNVPLSPCGIAYGDWVECTPPKRKTGNVRRVVRVYQPGGYGMVFAEVNETRPTRAAEFLAFVAALHALKWPVESMHDGFWLIAAVPPGQQQTAETLSAQHPNVDFNWSIEPLSHDPMRHPAMLPVPMKALTAAWQALKESFEDGSYSPHEDISEATRAALQSLGSLLDPLMNDESQP